MCAGAMILKGNLMTKNRLFRLAVLLSGEGTTVENIFNHISANNLNAQIVVVVSSRANALGLERARRRNVPAITVDKKMFVGESSADDFSSAIYLALKPYKPDLICCAGFMSLLRIPPRWEKRVLNVHPALLPAFGGKGFYGRHVHEAVLAAGVKITGCTVHYVNNEYDRGPIIAQREVPVLPNDTPDTLAKRVQAAERSLYPEAIRQVLSELTAR